MNWMMMQRYAPQACFARKCGSVRALVKNFLAACLIRKPHAPAEQAIWVREKLSLGPRKLLYLVSCRGREFLIAAGADTIVSVVEVFPGKAAQAGHRRKMPLAYMRKRRRVS